MLQAASRKNNHTLKVEQERQPPEPPDRPRLPGRRRSLIHAMSVRARTLLPDGHLLGHLSSLLVDASLAGGGGRAGLLLKELPELQALVGS